MAQENADNHAREIIIHMRRWVMILDSGLTREKNLWILMYMRLWIEPTRHKASKNALVLHMAIPNTHSPVMIVVKVKGMHRSVTARSAKAKFAMKIFVLVRICLKVIMVSRISEFPIKLTPISKHNVTESPIIVGRSHAD